MGPLATRLGAFIRLVSVSAEIPPWVISSGQGVCSTTEETDLTFSEGLSWSLDTYRIISGDERVLHALFASDMVASRNGP